jgi:hypothetical protein
VDFALDCPVPWKAEVCKRAATVHLDGTLDEISAGEAAVWRGEHPERPFVLLAQQSLFDETRAPEGKHTVWAYCHVPNGSTFDMTERIESQIERFAPGFRDRILAKSTRNSADLQRANYIGGDFYGGLQDFRQLLARPVLRLTPYSTPAKGLYLCSSSTPDGGGVHGLCGYFAARPGRRATALRTSCLCADACSSGSALMVPEIRLFGPAGEHGTKFAYQLNEAGQVDHEHRKLARRRVHRDEELHIHGTLYCLYRRDVFLRLVHPYRRGRSVPAAETQGLLALEPQALQLSSEVVELLQERVAGLDPPPTLVDPSAHQLTLGATPQRAGRFVAALFMLLLILLVGRRSQAATGSSTLWCGGLSLRRRGKG